jgi:hypothetical protein
MKTDMALWVQELLRVHLLCQLAKHHSYVHLILLHPSAGTYGSINPIEYLIYMWFHYLTRLIE